METKPLPKDLNALLDLAEEIANVLAERQTELGIGKDAEALLRAAAAAADFADQAYLAMRAARESPVAQCFLVPARQRCDRTLEQLRNSITRSIAVICRHMDDEDLTHVAEYVLSINA